MKNECRLLVEFVFKVYYNIGMPYVLYVYLNKRIHTFANRCNKHA